jgi:uncharacterized phiE125 gp8 family phage protein
VALNRNAIITLEEAKSYLKVEHDIEDSLIEGLINQASDQIEYDNNTCIVSQDFYDEPYDGTGDNFLILRNYPVNTIISVKIDNTEIPSSEYSVIGREGTLNFYRTLPPGPGRIKVFYNAGYPRDRVPGRFKKWCTQIVSDLYEGRGGEI